MELCLTCYLSLPKRSGGTGALDSEEWLTEWYDRRRPPFRFNGEFELLDDLSE